MPASPVLLDCTFRDGGYYNNWDFDRDMANRYLAALAAARVDIVEIGFRVPARDSFYGAFAYSTDEWLRQLTIPDGLDVAVMINAKDFLTDPAGSIACLDRLFAPQAESPVTWVRIAAHLTEVPKCAEGVRHLRALGYRIGFNIMQIASVADADIQAAVHQVRDWDCVEVIYFADSLGNMKEADISRVYNAFQAAWPGPIGIHAHNNMNRALANTLHARAIGVQWLDATVLGMGRGAGNTEIEHLLLELERDPALPYRADPVLQFIDRDFAALHEEYRWGPNRYYYLAGMLGVHPTYVQEMLTGGQYSSDDILTVLRSLDQHTARSFSSASLQATINSAYRNTAGRWNPAGWAEGKTILLVAGGDQARHHLPAIQAWASKHQPHVMALNCLSFLPADLVDTYVACHPTRIRAQAAAYRRAGKPLVIPWGALTEDEQGILAELQILDYGIHIEAGQFEARDTSCVLPYPLAVAYALCVLSRSGARRLLLCGFDGYQDDEKLHAQVNDIFLQFIQQNPQVEIAAVTPTSYHLPQRSIYMPTL